MNWWSIDAKKGVTGGSLVKDRHYLMKMRNLPLASRRERARPKVHVIRLQAYVSREPERRKGTQVGLVDTV